MFRTSPVPYVLSHWHRTFSGFQGSVKDFYTLLAAAIDARKLEGSTRSEATYREAGLASGERTYVRVSRKGLRFDLCGAPSGTSFFVSWWLSSPPPHFAIRLALCLACMAAWLTATLASFVMTLLAAGFAGKLLPEGAALALAMVTMAGSSFLSLALGLVIVFAALHLLVARRVIGEETVLAIPLFGWAYERIFAPLTFYRTDTALLFEAEVTGAFHEAIEAFTTCQGLQALTAEERKPLYTGFRGR